MNKEQYHQFLREYIVTPSPHRMKPESYWVNEWFIRFFSGPYSIASAKEFIDMVRRDTWERATREQYGLDYGVRKEPGPFGLAPFPEEKPRNDPQATKSTNP